MPVPGADGEMDVIRLKPLKTYKSYKMETWWREVVTFVTM